MALPLAIVAGAGAAASLGLSLAQYLDAKKKAEELYGEVDDIDLPKLIELNPNLLSGTSYENVQENPEMLQAQAEALRGMQDVYRQGGLTQADRAAINEQMAMANRDVAAQNAAIQSQAVRSGRGTGGSAMANRLLNQQMGANRGSQAGADVTQQAQLRALQALQQAGSMSGNIRGQDYQKASDLASARDRINLFNTQSKTDTDRYNAGLGQQKFQNKMSKMGMKTGIGMNNINQQYQLAGNLANAGMGLAKGAGDLFT